MNRRRIMKIKTSTTSSLSGGKRKAILALSTSLLAIGLLAGCSQEQGKGKAAMAMPPAEVGVVALHPSSVPIVSELSGRTAASLTAEVRPQIGGIIKERLFAEGGRVGKGEPLYRIDNTTYEQAVARAKASLEKARAELPAAAAKAERYKGLVSMSAASKQDGETVIADEAKARADIDAAKADLEAAETDLARTTVEAPISGIIGRSALTEGALVSANQTGALTTIRQIDPVNVDVGQSSTAFLKLRKAIADGRIKPEQGAVKVKLRLEDGSIYPHDGKLEFSESNVDLDTGMYSIRASFPNPDSTLLPGMFVRAVVEEGMANGSYLVPQRAVARNVKGEPTGLFVGKDSKIEERVLRIDGSVGNSWVVIDGIADGDRLVVEGGGKTKAGMEVKPTDIAVDDKTGLTVKTASNGK
jgi:membrane fusion protein (multidrug efflux system)